MQSPIVTKVQDTTPPPSNLRQLWFANNQTLWSKGDDLYMLALYYLEVEMYI